MTRKDVQIGKTYYKKVSGVISPVKVLYQNPDKRKLSGGYKHGGWTGRNENTGRNVGIATAASLRGEVIQKIALFNDALKGFYNDGPGTS
jgi:hypothetical protein